ncbi:hypothetical protein [Namhaeicola litoreus]|uniref:HEPN AbiU2-like domain-containing protein n=1 Tax=Namhaeicola litoreus TaxID=1052145 RepID=A0ABW3Y5V9_9FLAO
MKPELEERLVGLENIIHGIHHNLELMSFINYNLHREPFNLGNNLGLFWIWTSLMASQILEFYKLTNKKEKFSFTKTINIAKENKCKADFVNLETKTKELVEIYDKSDYEAVRSKYLAHQDLNVPEIGTELKGIADFSKKSVELFTLFCNEFKREQTEFNPEITESFSQIFKTIDEYEKVKALLIARLIQGNETIAISEIQDIVNENNSG